MNLKWTKYIPHEPFPQQLAFLLTTHNEVLYGGGAGGGKSDALLMAALQWVDVPGYSGLLIRKNLTDLEQPGALLTRAKEWLNPYVNTKEVKYDARTKTFTFPSTATISFGFVGEFRAEERYQGAEYQYVGFDELTQHFEADYLWLNHRIRRRKCDVHTDYDPLCKSCRIIKAASIVPLRMRATANPGGIGANWVKERFGIKKDPATNVFVGTIPERPFIPSLAKDNIFLDREEYIKRLEQLDPIRREQMLRGDWSINETGRFKPEWAKYYRQQGNYLIIEKSNTEDIVYRFHELSIFVTVDVASSEREGIGTTVFRNDREPSWSVLSVWGMSADGYLLLLEVVRFQDESPRIIKEMKRLAQIWRPQFFAVEQNGPGIVIAQLAARLGLSVKQVIAIKDKVANANIAQNMMLNGRIWFPKTAPWLEAWENELYNWTGHRYETDDQIDTLSNAANHLQLQTGHLHFGSNLSFTGYNSWESTPFAY